MEVATLLALVLAFLGTAAQLHQSFTSTDQRLGDMLNVLIQIRNRLPPKDDS
jgi:hypothetical protein